MDVYIVKVDGKTRAIKRDLHRATMVADSYARTLNRILRRMPRILKEERLYAAAAGITILRSGFVES